MKHVSIVVVVWLLFGPVLLYTLGKQFEAI